MQFRNIWYFKHKYLPNILYPTTDKVTSYTCIIIGEFIEYKLITSRQPIWHKEQL